MDDRASESRVRTLSELFGLDPQNEDEYRVYRLFLLTARDMQARGQLTPEWVARFAVGGYRQGQEDVQKKLA